MPHAAALIEARSVAPKAVNPHWRNGEGTRTAVALIALIRAKEDWKRPLRGLASDEENL